jgi:prepilin-type N-terminal cleavage/methylation domain-containing protein
MIQDKKGFTLLEVLISIMLLSLVLMALYRSVDILRASNKNLFNHLEKSSDAMKGARTLYIDLLRADSNISIESKEKKFCKIIINSTQNSLYGLYHAKVIWLVYKENSTILRIEGNKYNLPLKSDENINIDKIDKNIELFRAYRSKNKDKILVVLKTVGQDTESFVIQHLSKPRPKIKLMSPTKLSQDAEDNKHHEFIPAKI